MASVLKVDSIQDTSGTGNILMPNRPCFYAYMSSGTFAPDSSNSTKTPLNATEVNQGSCWSTTDHQFTAPVAGSYQFNFYSIIRGNYTNGYIQLYVSGQRIYGGDIHFTISNNSGSWHNVSFSQTLYLSANEYVELFSYTGSNSGNVDWHGNHWQCFSGWLLG